MTANTTSESGQTGADPAAEYQRFSLQVRVQHMVLASSVLVLIATGFPLWFLGRPEWMWWERETAVGLLGLATMRALHRVSGAVLLVVCVYHMGWVIFTREGRREFFLLLPRWKDFTDVCQNIMFFVGLRSEGPRFGRYTYYEKFDYWAVYWGCVIMVGSGLALWFDRFAAEYFAWFPYELAALIHADEAILAALALLIWHIYNVHLRPGIFPGSRVWLTGKVTHKQMLDEHPLEYDKHTKSQD